MGACSKVLLFIGGLPTGSPWAPGSANTEAHGSQGCTSAPLPKKARVTPATAAPGLASPTPLAPNAPKELRPTSSTCSSGPKLTLKPKCAPPIIKRHKNVTFTLVGTTASGDKIKPCCLDQVSVIGTNVLGVCHVTRSQAPNSVGDAQRCTLGRGHHRRLPGAPAVRGRTQRPGTKLAGP